MKKLFVIAILTLAVTTISCGQLKGMKTPVRTAYSIAGEYVLYRADDPRKTPVTKMIITAQDKDTFLVQGKGQTWVGDGKIEGKQGYYDWRFDNGSNGRTTFVINPDGTLTGHVIGSGIDWKYLARRIP
jgi:hypothetical protein